MHHHMAFYNSTKTIRHSHHLLQWLQCGNVIACMSDWMMSRCQKFGGCFTFFFYSFTIDGCPFGTFSQYLCSFFNIGACIPYHWMTFYGTRTLWAPCMIMMYVQYRPWRWWWNSILIQRLWVSSDPWTLTWRCFPSEGKVDWRKGGARGRRGRVDDCHRGIWPIVVESHHRRLLDSIDWGRVIILCGYILW